MVENDKMKKALVIFLVTIFVLIAAFLVFRESSPKDFVVGDNEIALYIQMDTKEDIGLLVFDYSVNGSEHSGGISNADKSLMKHDELLIHVWNKENLQCSADTVAFSIQRPRTTEYAYHNYNDIYPAHLTNYLERITYKAHFGA